MATKAEIEELRAVLRRVAANHPGADVDFLDAVLTIEVEAGEDDALALQRIEAALNWALGKGPLYCCG